MWFVLWMVLALWCLPAVWARRNGRQFVVRGEHDGVVDLPLADCSLWIRNAHNLPLYEPKVERCWVDTTGPQVAYTCEGSFCGLPWRGTFSMQPTPDGGFHSVMIAGPHTDNASGGFRLRQTAAGTRICHYERYDVSVWIPFAVLFRPLLQGWLARSMEHEMRTLEFAMLQTANGPS